MGTENVTSKLTLTDLADNLRACAGPDHADIREAMLRTAGELEKMAAREALLGQEERNTTGMAGDLVRLAGDLRDHADPESDPNPANVCKVMRYAADKLDKLAAGETLPMLVFGKETTIRFKSTPVKFAGWLERHIEPVVLPLSPDGERYISISHLTRPERMTGPIRLVINGRFEKPDPDCAEAALTEHGEVVTFDVIPLNDYYIEVEAICCDLAAVAIEYFDGLLAEIKQAWLVVHPNTETIGKSGAAKRGMRPWRQERAKLFKRLKDAHPKWSQEKVAIEATKETCKRLENAHPEWSADEVDWTAAEELGGTITEDTVRNDYKSMGWTWERANRIR